MAVRIAARLVALVMVFTLAPVVTATAAPGFTDVPSGAYYTEAVDWLVAQSITQGTSPTTFSPDDPVTRAQMAAFVWRFGYEYGGVANSFVDVPTGVYYETAVGWLVLHGITQGTSATTYGPSDPVTRAQMAVVLWRFAGEPAPTTPAAFSDVPFGEWYTDAVWWLVEQGITQGTSPTMYSPYATVNRAQIATFLWRFAGEPTPGTAGVDRDPGLYDCALQTAIPTIECEALIAIKAANPSATLPDWGIDPDPSSWGGVTVTGGVVTGLGIFEKDISILPPEIGDLTSLTTLQLFNNRLTALPAEIGDLTSLTNLQLSGNQLTAVPAEIGNLTSLIYVELIGNQLTAVPAEIGNLTSLTTLHLAENRLTAVPAEIGNLTSLTLLSLGDNLLTAVPAEIGNLTSLTLLSLINNQLTALPAEIGNLTSLTTLQLFNNQLAALPAEIGNLTSLTDLWLGSNQLAAVPAEIGNLTSLTNLRLGDNLLSALPVEIGNLTSVANLELFNNYLTAVPAEIGNLTNVTILLLYNNQLTAVPAEIGNLTSLTNLNLLNNLLTAVPAEIGNLTSLTTLYLSWNQLTTVPIEMMGLTNLTLLELRGQSPVCLSVADAGFEAWLAGHDPLWNDGCP